MGETEEGKKKREQLIWVREMGQSQLQRKRSDSFFLRRIHRQENVADLLHFNFAPLFAGCPIYFCVCVTRKKTGYTPPPSFDKGRRWLALLSFGVGWWYKQTPANGAPCPPMEFISVPHWKRRQTGGPAYNKKSLEILNSPPLPHPDTPFTTGPWPLGPHQVTCTDTKVGGMPKHRQGKERERERETTCAWKETRLCCVSGCNRV